jgi:hypothetical protein
LFFHLLQTTFSTPLFQTFSVYLRYEAYLTINQTIDWTMWPHILQDSNFFCQCILNIAYLLIFEKCFILAGFADDHA